MHKHIKTIDISQDGRLHIFVGMFLHVQICGNKNTINLKISIIKI